MSLRVACPAKINLHLRVGRQRADGFHPLLSWMCTVGLFDTLTLERQSANAAGSIALSCDDPALPCDQRNLVVRAGEAWLAERDARANYRVHLEKRIPAGGGLGGGSSDGARMLVALNILEATGASPTELAEFAARFGSDLSFFMFAPSAACRGRGELVEPLPAPLPRWALLALPELAMPTPAVYRRFDELMERGGGAVRPTDDDGEVAILAEPDWREWASLSAGPLLRQLQNDLEAPAFSISPALGALRADMEQSLQRPIRMSGSGSTLFTLFDAEHEARAAAGQVAGAHAVRAVAVELAPRFTDSLNDNAGRPAS